MRLRHFAPLFTGLLLSAGCADTKPDCMGDAVVCGGSCTELKSDNLNCGACGTACEAGKVCSNGTCAVTCAAGLVDCGGKCIDPATDRAFCGASGVCTGVSGGTACGTGQVCSGGSCQLSCQGGLVDCGGKCIDPMTDRAFCGASGACTGVSAGAVCASGRICSAGACALSCQPGLVDCGGTCLDPRNDPRACGADATCGGGQTCGAGFACDVGQCVLACQAGLVDCGGKCIDPASDRIFCGASGDCAGTNDGTVCSSGQVCSGGTCTTSCPPSEYSCGGKCIDPQTDPNYCGAVSNCTGGTACGANSACYKGICEPLCAGGQVMCNSTCISPQTDHTYCGASAYCTGVTAGTTCSATQTCVAGVCDPPPCSWQQIYSADLTSLPAGVTPYNGAAGGQSAQAIYGRTCWLMTSDWAWLVFPIVFGSGDDVFAIEADVYFPTPVLTPYRQGGGIFAFNTATPGNGFGTHGISTSVSFNSGALTALDWWAYPSPAGSANRSTTISYGFNSWHRLRVEGRRSSCSFRAYIGGVLTDSWTGTCDTTGANLSLTGGLNAAWSNLALYRGLGACPP